MNAEDEKILKTPYLKIGRKLHLLLHTGQLLMEGGADTNRIVRDMMRAAVFMGIPEPQVPPRGKSCLLRGGPDGLTRHRSAQIPKVDGYALHLTTTTFRG